MVRKFTVSAAALAVFVGMAAASAWAQGTSDRKTYFTFSAPIELPGQTLPAGRYMFRIPEADAQKRVVEVSNGDGTKSFGYFYTMNAARLPGLNRIRSSMTIKCPVLEMGRNSVSPSTMPSSSALSARIKSNEFSEVEAARDYGAPWLTAA